MTAGAADAARTDAMSGPFHFDSQQLLEAAGAHRDRYATAQPFPHVVLDDFLPEAVLDEILEEFPSPRQEGWLHFESENERKLASRDQAGMGEATRALLAEMNSSAFLGFLQELTGIAGLIPDPWFEGGGLHQIVRGGHLNVHVDFNRDPRTGLDRRLNVLIYLNRDWPEEFGGALELWSPDMQRCEQRILPLFNRLVVFSTTEQSFHGHPHPLVCPEDRSRRSLALYYYSNGRPEENGGAAASHNTVWATPGAVPVDRRQAALARIRHMARRLLPPVLLDAAKAARARQRD
ncbi:MAG: 2OG-Fe(II) oxygenase [Solirubrobacteraceae bacterium]